MLWQIMGVVFGAGCIGGFVNGRKAEKWGLRYKDPKCDTWFAGVLGYVLLGGIAAVVFWGLYGPFTEATVLGPEAASDVTLKLTFGQLMGSVLMGISGPGFLRAESSKRCAERQLYNALSE
jgi:hypothetical protein